MRVGAPRLVVEAGITAGFLTFLVVVVFIGVISLLISWKEQRNALREIAQGLGESISERDDAIAHLQLQRLDPDHEEGIRETLRFVEGLVTGNRRVEFDAAGARDSLAGHVPTALPLIDNWNDNALADFVIADRLSKREEQAISEFDHRVYSHDALRKIFDFAMHRATTPEFGTPFQIPGARV